MAAFNWQAMLQSLGGIPQGNPLDPNLGRQPQPPQEAPVTVEDIVVNAARQPEAAPPPAPPNMGNRDFLDEAAAARGTAPQRKGMFGTKGTIRDILGILGDAFLIQSGNKAMYQPQRQAEKQGDALAGFTQDPLAAIERLAAGGFGDQAQELSKNYNTNEVARQTAGRAAQIAKDANYQKYSQIYGQYMGAATPETYERIKPLLEQLKKRGELGDEFQIPDVYDENIARTYQYGGMPATRQVQTEQFDRSQTERERHNKASETTSRISATRPRAGRNAPQPTAMSQAAPILQKVQRGEKLTPGETEVLNRTAPIRGKGARTPPPLPPGFSIK